jgi:hypothetical protein
MPGAEGNGRQVLRLAVAESPKQGLSSGLPVGIADLREE